MSAITKVNIRNPDGTPGFGFLKDGVTYKDEAATQRIDEGTKVSANGKIYTYNGEGNPTGVTNVMGSGISNPNGTNYNGVSSVYYTTPDGKRQKGYSKDGRTYTDEGLTTRVPVGTTVHTAGGDYRMTSDGGVMTGQTMLNKLQADNQRAMEIYKAAEEAQRQRIDANVQAVVNRLNNQKNDAEEEKREAERKAYAAYRTAVNPYGARAQQIASLGLGDSGFSETSLASLGNQYQQAISDAELARNKALREIELQIEDARLSGDAQKAEALSAYYQNVANMSLQNAQTYIALAQNVATAADARDQVAYTMAQDKKNEYLAWIQLGIVPNDAAAVLDRPQAELDALAMYYKSQRNGNSGGSRGSTTPAAPTGGFNG